MRQPRLSPIGRSACVTTITLLLMNIAMADPLRGSWDSPLSSSVTSGDRHDWYDRDEEAMLAAFKQTNQTIYFAPIFEHPDIRDNSLWYWNELIELLDALEGDGNTLTVIPVFSNDYLDDDGEEVNRPESEFEEIACRMRALNAEYPDNMTGWMVDDFQKLLCREGALNHEPDEGCMAPMGVQGIWSMGHDERAGCAEYFAEDTADTEYAFTDWESGEVDFYAYLSSNTLLDAVADSVLLGGLTCTNGVDSMGTMNGIGEEDGEGGTGICEAKNYKFTESVYATLTYTLDITDITELHASFLYTDNQHSDYDEDSDTCNRDLALVLEIGGEAVWYDFFWDGRDDNDGHEAIEYADLDLTDELNEYLDSSSDTDTLELQFVVKIPDWTDSSPMDFAAGCSSEDIEDPDTWLNVSQVEDKLALIAGLSFTDKDGYEVVTEGPVGSTSGGTGLLAGENNDPWKIIDYVDGIVFTLSQDQETQTEAHYQALIDVALDGAADSGAVVLPMMRGYFNDGFVPEEDDFEYWKTMGGYALSSTDGMIYYRMPLDVYQLDDEGIFTERDPGSNYDFHLYNPKYVPSMVGWNWYQQYALTVPEGCDGNWTLTAFSRGGSENESHNQYWSVAVNDVAVGDPEIIASEVTYYTDVLELDELDEIIVKLTNDGGRVNAPELQFIWEGPSEECGEDMSSGIFSSGFAEGHAEDLYEMIKGLFFN